jgi:serine phosphatase RsbU (regulator of sigma subunit)
MLRITLLHALLYLTSFNCISQLSTIDSLKSELGTSNNDHKFEVISQLYDEYRKSEPDSALKYAYQGLNLARQLQDSVKTGKALNSIGSYYQSKGAYDTCLTYYNQALDIYETIDHVKGSATTYGNMGVVFRKLGNFDKALNYQFQSLRLRENINNTSGIAKNLHNIGGIYYYMNNYKKAVEYFTRAREKNMILGNTLEVAKGDNNIGSVFMELGELDSALYHYQKALDYFLDHDYEIYAAILQDNIGSIYGKMGKYDEALRYHFSTLNIHMEHNNSERLAHTYNNIGVLYMKIGEEANAEKYLYQGLKLAREINNRELIYEILHSLYENAEQTQKYQKALNYFKQHSVVKDSIMSEKTHQQMVELETKYETEKKEQQIELQKSQLYQKEAVIKQQQTQKYLFATASVSILLITLILARSYIEKRKTNRMLASKNKSITESITYAQKIQSAVLPPEDLINHMLPEHFILYLPRDIVSGDFYWITRINNQTVIAVADCTGHGVPGAFMSMLGFTLLNEVVNGMKLLQANIILNELRSKVKKSLRQKGDEHEAQDGMDIALCIIDQDQQHMQYAGANNPLILISDGELTRIKPDLMPVGIQINERNSFTNHQIDLKKGDILYLFSDGYIDQFGGENGSRFKAGNFERLLAEIWQKDMPLQHEILKERLLKWKNGYDQIDDILVMGIRI